MTPTVCLASGTAYYPQGAGHLWVSLNWALGLLAAGCRVIWLEGFTAAHSSNGSSPAATFDASLTLLRTRLAPYGLDLDLGAFSWDGGDVPAVEADRFVAVGDAAAEADLLLSLSYGVPEDVVGAFRRSALVDLDPGLLQVWLAAGTMSIARYDSYFTIGETVGRPGARFPDCGLDWRYTPPPVSLDAWPLVRPPDGEAAFTTVSDWWGNWMDYDGALYPNGKRDSFLAHLDLAGHAPAPVELAVVLTDWDADDRRLLEERGWRVVDPWQVASTPDDYRAYVQSSRGELSCVKPSCVHLQNAWISDRTICYLATGRPAIVQHTGPSRFLPDRAGLFRFRDVAEAVAAFEIVASEYERECRAARELAEEYFDAEKVARSVLDQALA